MGKRKPIVYFLVTSIAVMATTSHADEKKGWALSVGIGPSQIRDRDGADSFDASGFGFTWGPEYRFSKRWALGVDFYSLGSGTDNYGPVDTRIDVGGFDFRGRVIFPISEKVEFYGRLGFGGYFADLDPGGSTLGEHATSFGLGLDIDTGEHFSLRFDGRYLDGKRDESGALLTAGFNYRF
jgi:hypothetical protein